MKRHIYDVPLWHLYLHRRAAKLHRASKQDDRTDKLADEIFERLYSQPTEVEDPSKDATWAMIMHTKATEIIAEEKITGTQGKAKESAEATKKILEKLKEDDGGGGGGNQPNPTPQGQGTQAQSAAPTPGAPTARDVADGLSQVQVGQDKWTGEWKGDAHADAEAERLAKKLKKNGHLRRIAELAGRFKRIMLSKQKTKVKRGVDEITDITQGDDLSRLLPTELIRFASKRQRLAAMRDLLERKCLQYEMTSTEILGRGPVVFCVDKSGSMMGQKDMWASAIGLALMDMAHRQRRAFVLLGFNEQVPQRVVVRPGNPMEEKELCFPCNGGTDIDNVISLALHAVDNSQGGVMKRADIVLISDGESYPRQAASLKARARKADVNILGIGIGVAEGALSPWCEKAFYKQDVSELLDDDTATMLFDN